MERTAEIRARCSIKERAALDLMAAMEGISSTEWIREHVRYEAKRTSLWDRPITFFLYCKLFGITHKRDKFHEWCKANEAPTLNTLDAWENYTLTFETDGDAADLVATQARALK